MPSMTREPGVPRLVLASGSASRRRMLEAAGVEFRVFPADIDEEAITRELQVRSPPAIPEDIAQALAAAKALAVSERFPHALVIGSDQVLSCQGDIFSKPGTVENARAMLRLFRGKSHTLSSAVALAGQGQIIWSSLDRAHLTMRSFSEDFLEQYLSTAGPAVLGCAGCYQIEGAGIQLFEHVEGDHFTIQGMPLIPLLAELRTHGVLAS
jgi:septum formation protein